MMRLRLCQQRLTGRNFKISCEADRASRDKKIGAESSDPNRHSQPRLPGSVVGDASMRPHWLSRQDYRGQCPKVTNATGVILSAAALQFPNGVILSRAALQFPNGVIL